MLTKICKQCGVEKPLDAFDKSSSNKLGYATTCKECRSHLTPERKEELHKRDELILQGRKVCYRCKIEKDVSEFSPNKQTRDGYKIWCKDCNNKYETTGQRNETRLVFKRKFHHSDKGKACTKRRHEKEEFKEYQREYSNTEKYKETQHNYNTSGKRQNAKLKRTEEQINESRAYFRNYYKQKTETNKNFSIACRLRGRLISALNRQNIEKKHHTFDLVGCSIDFFNKHLESLFTEGMTWNNRGEWEIDHIRPCASFDLTDPEQQKICFHYTNLQPLWAKDNRSKGSLFEGKRYYRKAS